MVMESRAVIEKEEGGWSKEEKARASGGKIVQE